ncbi:MAG: hypothetical protein GY946_09425 [bacterium]|nr:hypothetical protein [bacterium]
MDPIDGDQAAAAGSLFDEHHVAVWRLLYRLAGPTVADDLAAEVFCVALDRIGSFDARLGSERAWLLGIAVNLVRTHRRGSSEEAGQCNALQLDATPLVWAPARRWSRRSREKSSVPPFEMPYRRCQRVSAKWWCWCCGRSCPTKRQPGC